MKVVMVNVLGQPFYEELCASFPGVDFELADTREEQLQRIRDADVFIGGISRPVYLAAERLRWIHVPGAGINWIHSIPELIASDVILTNALGPHDNPMADHVFAMMLTFGHCMRELWADQRAHRWDSAKYYYRMVELNGRTMGILALGGVGRAVARRAHGFGMDVYGVDLRPMAAPAGVKEVWGLDRLDDLLQISDWFVVTAPLTSQTRGLIDRRRIGLLKPGAYVIVVSRGGIVDETAMIDGLRSGHIAGAGLDVFEKEPLDLQSPLWDMDNVLISPHTSSTSPELWGGRREIVKENLRRFLADKPLLYVCDKEAGF